MKYSPLGSSGIDVSRVCLGSMTWGLQNSQQDADAQIAYALDHGVNFIDTAEMYAIPPSPDTYGKTETIIGDWINRNRDKRTNIILASKIAGPGLPWVRAGGRYDGDDVIQAVEHSLQRLQTDYIDLFQLHWPNRQNPHFGNHWPNTVRPSTFNREQETEQMLDILQGLQRCIDSGKVRFAGLSDDTPWGISAYLRLAETHNLPKMVSIQNEFNLLHTKDWPYLTEQCIMEDIAYLPWSPLATGILSGKYLDGARPTGSRWTLSQRNGLFRDTDRVHAATRAYAEVAKDHNISTAALALAWCNQVDGVTSTIIGATNIEQLQENIAAFNIEYSDGLASDVEAVLQKYPTAF